jgi:hypothetical protein
MTLDNATVRPAGTLRLLAASICAATLLTACGGGGDVKLDASSSTVINDNSTNNSGGGGSTNPCANYLDPTTNTRISGAFDGTNCVYGPEFVGETNPLLVDLTIPFIDGAHIFEDTLQVGRNVDGSNPAETVPQDGEGPTLTIRAGNTLVWTDPEDYLLVHRGSRLVAQGTSVAPITLTGFSDAILGNAGKEETQLWGGLVLNGNGITNKCTDAQRAAGTCHVLAEGKPSNYGGNNNAESSGSLKYVVVKHPGFEVAPGDELNGVTLNAVGSGTSIEYLQVYSTYDDGVEMFGGAARIDNLVALYVQDDSIDWADGWVGEINKALVIQSSEDGDRCIEADNQESAFSALPLSSPTIRNLTCIPGGAPQPPATHGSSMGLEFRRGTEFKLEDSILFSGHAQAVLNQPPGRCLRVTDTETAQRAQAGNSSVKSTLIACSTPTSNGTNWTAVFTNGDSVANWVANNGAGAYPANTNNRLLTVSGADAAGANLQILDGFYTATQFQDATGAAFTVNSVSGDPIGAVTAADDWTRNWTFGLDDLWF